MDDEIVLVNGQYYMTQLDAPYSLANSMARFNFGDILSPVFLAYSCCKFLFSDFIFLLINVCSVPTVLGHSFSLSSMRLTNGVVS